MQFHKDVSLEDRRSERGHFGSIPQTQQPRHANQNERDRDVPITTAWDFLMFHVFMMT